MRQNVVWLVIYSLNTLRILLSLNVSCKKGIAKCSVKYIGTWLFCHLMILTSIGAGGFRSLPFHRYTLDDDNSCHLELCLSRLQSIEDTPAGVTREVSLTRRTPVVDTIKYIL